jgi:hypothetical protein
MPFQHVAGPLRTPLQRYKETQAIASVQPPKKRPRTRRRGPANDHLNPHGIASLPVEILHLIACFILPPETRYFPAPNQPLYQAPNWASIRGKDCHRQPYGAIPQGIRDIFSLSRTCKVMYEGMMRPWRPYGGVRSKEVDLKELVVSNMTRRYANLTDDHQDATKLFIDLSDDSKEMLTAMRAVLVERSQAVQELTFHKVSDWPGLADHSARTNSPTGSSCFAPWGLYNKAGPSPCQNCAVYSSARTFVNHAHGLS